MSARRSLVGYGMAVTVCSLASANWAMASTETVQCNFNETSNSAPGHPKVVSTTGQNLDGRTPFSGGSSQVFRLGPGDLLTASVVGPRSFTGKRISAELKFVYITEERGCWGFCTKKVRNRDDGISTSKERVELGDQIDVVVIVRYLGNRPTKSFAIGKGELANGFRLPATADVEVRLVTKPGSVVWTPRHLDAEEQEIIEGVADQDRVNGGYDEIEWISQQVLAGDVGNVTVQLSATRP